MMQKQIKKLNLAVLMLVIAVSGGANNIQVNNISLTGENTTEDYVMIQFDLSWENSWRIITGPANWDAAWVFVKYRITADNGGDDLWKHAWLNNTGHSGGSGTPVTINGGLFDPGSAFDPTTNPALGVFVYRSGPGSGTFTTTGMQLRWNYGKNGVADDDLLEIKVFAIEMVYVPQGSFYIGSGGTETAAFYRYPTTTNTIQVTSENAITVGTATDNLYYPSTTYGGDRGGPIPVDFPKGYFGFYCQKYEITQQQYVDFLNTLTYTQQDARINGSPDATVGTFTNNDYRHKIKIHTSGVATTTLAIYETEHPNVACNYLSWIDGAAYADWAGLRPMTELEYEKACRGTLSPVANEYAWGSATVANSAYTLGNAGLANEGIANNYSTTAGNASCVTTDGSIDGPLRVGIFAGHASNTGRITAGASYYGIMELSGNLWERAVTVGSAAGRAFTGVHGDGALSANGHANVTAWPGLTGTPGEVTGATGSGFRGGSWAYGATYMRVSDRFFAAHLNTSRVLDYGFRAVRTPSEPPGQPSAILGPVDPCQVSAGNVYAVTPHPNVTYTWSVPTGWSITGSQNTHEITVTAGTTAGNIEVIPYNIWGYGPGQTLAVTTQDCYPAGTVHCDPDNPTAIVDVYNPSTGRTWMDRNLGASQVATSSTDAASYGDLYQWGRLADGHQCRNSGTTGTLSLTDNPGHGYFITVSSSPYDWRSPQNTGLWQGVSGVNNPCPSGYRLPTAAELNAERLYWIPGNATGAFASPLKLPMAGYRHLSSGSVWEVGSNGRYWTSTVSVIYSEHLTFDDYTFMSDSYRAYGYSVRCIKDY